MSSQACRVSGWHDGWEAWTASPGLRQAAGGRSTPGLKPSARGLRRSEKETGTPLGAGPPAVSERLEAAQWHEAEAYAAAALVLASSAEAFRRAAEAHERVASLHKRAAASGMGDVRQHERQAVLHRAAAAADWQRAERARSVLSEPEWPGPNDRSLPGGQVLDCGGKAVDRCGDSLDCQYLGFAQPELVFSGCEKWSARASAPSVPVR